MYHANGDHGHSSALRRCKVTPVILQRVVSPDVESLRSSYTGLYPHSQGASVLRVPGSQSGFRCRANMAHTRQSRLDSSRDFQVKALYTCHERRGKNS